MFHRALCVLAVSAAVGLSIGAPALAAPGSPPLSATLETCHGSEDAASRYATFAAQMSAIPGTEQMAIRFLFEERAPGVAEFRPILGAPGIGVWKTSAPAVGIFGFSQEVSRLPQPATFHVIVDYRWTGVRHRVLRRARRITPACSLLPLVASSPSSLVAGPLG